MLAHQREEARKIEAQQARQRELIHTREQEINELSARIVQLQKEAGDQQRKNKVQLKSLKRIYHDQQVELEAEIGIVRKGLADLQTIKQMHTEEIENLQAARTKIQKQIIDQEILADSTKQRLAQDIVQLERQTSEAHLKAAHATEIYDKTAKRLSHIQKQLAAGEQTFSTRTIELRNILHEQETTVRQLREQAREYEEGMRETRKNDTIRAATLDRKEANLAARERLLAQEKLDLAARRRRFNQLKDIQQ